MKDKKYILIEVKVEFFWSKELGRWELIIGSGRGDVSVKVFRRLPLTDFYLSLPYIAVAKFGGDSWSGYKL